MTTVQQLIDFLTTLADPDAEVMSRHGPISTLVGLRWSRRVLESPGRWRKAMLLA
jgi:hypothetical protein